VQARAITELIDVPQVIAALDRFEPPELELRRVLEQTLVARGLAAEEAGNMLEHVETPLDTLPASVDRSAVLRGLAEGLTIRLAHLRLSHEFFDERDEAFDAVAAAIRRLRSAFRRSGIPGAESEIEVLEAALVAMQQGSIMKLEPHEGCPSSGRPAAEWREHAQLYLAKAGVSVRASADLLRAVGLQAVRKTSRTF
jgi:hypothetical protein